MENSCSESSDSSTSESEAAKLKLAVRPSLADSSNSFISSSIKEVLSADGKVRKNAFGLQDTLLKTLDQHVSSSFVFTVKEDMESNRPQQPIHSEFAGVRLFLQSEVFLLCDNSGTSSMSVGRDNSKSRRSVVDRIFKDRCRRGSTGLRFKRKSEMLEAAVDRDWIQKNSKITCFR
uniref:Uncharacterized protein n=1 Tax=Trichuris muris TaxID=70415 RepID=A0A5S6QFZ5_TRIMR